MNLNRTIFLLKTERECVLRNEHGACDRNCASCNLVQKTEDLVLMYSQLIETLELIQAFAGGKNV